MWNNGNYANYPGGSSYRPPSGPPPSFPSPGYGSSYAPPPGPPGGYAPPSGPPTGYGPPPGPPSHSSSYPGRQYQQNPGAYPGQFQSQWGGPPPLNYQSRPSYSAPAGPPPPPPSQQQYYGPQFQGSNGMQQQPFFQYSQCNGKKKALCIGINYFGQSAELKGCINDARNMRNFLRTRFGYQEDDIVMLTDDSTDPRSMPTRANMLRAMQWLVRGAQPNDSLFFHYSGHGGQTKDLDGDEDDGYDEVVYPVDFESEGHIVDDLLHDIMVKPLPPGARLTAIFDSCHSGTALDLPYIYSTEGIIKEPNLAAEAGQGLLGAVSSYAKGDMSGVFSSAQSLFRLATGSAQKAEQVARATKTSPADCISFSGCKDDQTSADAYEAGRATGAMSYAFITALNQNPQQSYLQLLNSLRQILRAKYSQKPQLSCSHPMDVNLLFIA